MARVLQFQERIEACAGMDSILKFASINFHKLCGPWCQAFSLQLPILKNNVSKFRLKLSEN